MDKHILVAGGAGFIGSHLVKKFVSQGDYVYIVDNLCTGRIDNIEDVDYTGLFDYDISMPYHLHSKIGGIVFDEIWNCACPASPVAYRKMPMLTLDTCYKGTKQLLEMAYVCNAKYIHLSTSEIYGSTDADMVESNWGYVNSYGPRACYDEGKRVAEALIYEYQAAGEVDARIFRLFNTYGPGMQFNDGRVIPNFIMAALTDRPLRIYGSNKKTRTFCYVEDVVETLILAASKDYNKPLNIGTEHMKYASLHLLAENILSLCPNSKSKIVVDSNNNPKDDPMYRRPNINKLREVCGKLPDSHTFMEGLEKTIEYFRDLIAKNPEICNSLNDESFLSYKEPKF